jgi:hypothetical protein
VVDKVNDAMIAPAVETEPEQPSYEARAEGNEGETEIQPEEETADLKVGADPAMPSAADVAEHRVTHMPYRSWCKHCVAGRGVGEQRGRHAGRKHDIPRVGIDYWFITSGGDLKRRKELEEEYPLSTDGDAKLESDRIELKIMKCLAVRCHESKAVFAHAIPVKGRGEDNFVADLVKSDVEFMGHVKLILKSDNEPALLALGQAALLSIRCDVVAGESKVESISFENSAEHDSQSNGGTECGIRAVRGVFRTVKLCLEERLGRKVPSTHPLMTWLVEYSALLLNAKQVGEDGKTSWSRLRGRDFGQKLIGFGEAVLYKQPPKGPQHDVHGNMGPRMFPGRFLGYSCFSNTYLVETEDHDVVKVRSILRRPEADRWDEAKLQGVKATPWSLRATSSPAAMELGQPVPKDAPPQDDAVPLPRRLKITMKVLEEFGTTDGCPQCMHIRSFKEMKPGIAHSEACRKRIVEEMKLTAAGAARVERQELRTNRALAEHVEAGDRDPADRVPSNAEPHPRDAGLAIPLDEYLQTAGGRSAQAALDKWSRPGPNSDLHRDAGV